MYNYEHERPKLFTDDGQRLFLKIRDNCQRLMKLAGAARLGNIIAGNMDEPFVKLACVDRLVELGEIRCLSPENVAGQDRVFVSTRSEP